MQELLRQLQVCCSVLQCVAVCCRCVAVVLWVRCSCVAGGLQSLVILQSYCDSCRCVAGVLQSAAGVLQSAAVCPDDIEVCMGLLRLVGSFKL